jgi:hypothetical protein
MYDCKNSSISGGVTINPTSPAILTSPCIILLSIPKFSRRNLTFEINLRILLHNISKPTIVLNKLVIHFHLVYLMLGHHHVGCAGHHTALELGVKLGGLAEGFGLLHH